jgi:hypothetical protein
MERLMQHNIFAIELCLRLEPDGTLRSKLADLVRRHPETSSRDAKWRLVRDASMLLYDNAHLIERGCWDFFDDDARALKDYEMWTGGLTTKEGARPEPSGRPSEGEPRFMTFTISLLIKDDSQCARDMADLCDIPESELWHRATILRILRGLKCLNFAVIKSDVLYLLPRDEEWGLTYDDLEHEKFVYFRPII